MNRRNRLALLVAAVLVLAATGSVLANRAAGPSGERAAPASSNDPDDSPSASDLAHAADRLGARGIVADSALLEELSAQYGLGGAVRLFAWADSTALSIDELRAMRDEGMGWGEIARDLDVHPGIGSIMGNGGGHGREGAPGQQKDPGSDE